MTLKETQTLEEFKAAKKSGGGCMQRIDFGFDRPTSLDFWKALRKLGRVEVGSVFYSVTFHED